MASLGLQEPSRSGEGTEYPVSREGYHCGGKVGGARQLVGGRRI
jgi:hypothetical protein